MWRAYSVDRHVKTAVEGLFAPEVAADFLKLVRKRVPTLPLADVRASLARARFTLDLPPVQLPPRTPEAPKVAASATAEPKPVSVAPGEPVADKTPWRRVTLQDLISSGKVRLPLDIETTYKGHQLSARIEADGSVTWNGTTYDSLSTAGGMARKSIVGAPLGREYPQTDGWTFWRFRDSDGRLAFVDALRRRHFAR